MSGPEERPDRPDGSGPPTVRLSMVIPAYNEGGRLHAGVARLSDAVAAGAIDAATTEFVVVDDGSSDDTAAQAALLFSSFPHVQVVRLTENRGKGAAVHAGVRAATGSIIAFADADMAIDPGQTPEFVTALGRADVAIGSRAASGASVNRPSIRRSAMNRAFNRLVNAMTRVSLDDTQCGFKAFRAPAAKLLFHCSVTERFAFDVEILSLSRRLGFTIAEVPVRWLRVKGSRIRPWVDVGSMARDVLRASRSAARAPAVEALVLQVGAESGVPDRGPLLGSLRRHLSAQLPILSRPDGAVLVLCPLMTADEISATAEQIRALAPAAELSRDMLTTGQLGHLAPLALSWDDETEASTMR